MKILCNFAANVKYSTDYDVVDSPNNNKLNFVKTGISSSVFFHELLDEFLNYYVNKAISDESPALDQVKYQNNALQNSHQPLRNGEDHER